MYFAQSVLVISGLVSLIALPIRWIARAPSIEIRSVPWQGAGPTLWTFAQVEVRNRPVSRWLSWAFTRNTAFDSTSTAPRPLTIQPARAGSPRRVVRKEPTAGWAD